MAEQVLARNRDPHLVPELTRFNLEINLEPVLLEGDGLRRLERQLLERLAHVRKLTCDLGDDIALCGILPTIHLSDLTLDNMTPRPRYARLNEAITRLRGGPLQLQITGIDELFVQLDSIMVEAVTPAFRCTCRSIRTPFPAATMPPSWPPRPCWPPGSTPRCFSVSGSGMRRALRSSGRPSIRGAATCTCAR